ncbi:MAG: ATP-binding protein [Gammaproteobacteria bacterium]|nr:ATP-binding protein [Gammaproteobacteria bacterium]
MVKAKKPPSIHLRLLGASLLILPVFLGVTAVVLDRAFANYQMESQQESMRLQQLLLAKAAEWDGSRWSFDGLDELRFNLLRSGLYAFVLSGDARVLWQSPSAELVAELEDPAAAVKKTVLQLGLNQIEVGQSRFRECELGPLHFCHSTLIAWGSSGPESIFLIVESRDRVLEARNAYRNYLLWLSLATALLLLLAQSAIFRWGLAPLRRIARAIGLLERGESEQLVGPYPEELVPLTDNLNVLLASEKRRRERVRNTMDRLTHVLKTPLMLIRNSSDGDREFRDLVQEQVTRMLGIVEGELAKARLDGRAADILGKPVPVKPVLERIAAAYSRLPRRSEAADPQQAVTISTTAISEQATFYGEERDLQDLFGSILENSLKYCRQRIEISAEQQLEAGEENLVLTIADDGDGIPAGLEQDILRRGARADSANIGQGLGLSIVVEIVSAYGGSLNSARSSLGGALFVVKLPTDSSGFK